MISEKIATLRKVYTAQLEQAKRAVQQFTIALAVLDAVEASNEPEKAKEPAPNADPPA